MKHPILVLLLMAFPFLGISQQTLNGSITHDGMQREYILYVPANYSGNDPVPLVFNFHGYTSNAAEQMQYGDFRSIADTAGFIIVHPQGAKHLGSTHWNVGGWIIGSPIDDVSFTHDLLDTLTSAYNINLERIYSTGMSNGGFMSFLLACQLSSTFAAIAPVAGSMTPKNFNGCNPQRPVPVMQIHGTTDPVIAYTGVAWSKPVNAAIQYWITFNNCDINPTATPLPNTNTSDGSTVEHFLYEGGNNGSTIEHYKVSGGGHSWPGTNGTGGGLSINRDFDASAEIWRFFSQYDVNGLITTDIDDLKELSLSLYPNPVQSHLNIDFETTQQVDYQLATLAGQVVLSGAIHSDHHEIDLRQLPTGMYVLKIGSGSYKILKTE